MNRIFVALTAALTSSAIAQGPVPPAMPPPELVKPVDGYDMSVPYQIWRDWVERQKGPVITTRLETPDKVDGLQTFGLLLRFSKHHDLGQFLAGDLRGYCKEKAPDEYVPEPGTCRYLLRRAFVPHPAEPYGEPNPVSDWTRKNFNGQALARHFKGVGLGPGTNWWLADPERMFSASPSPRAVLVDNIVVARLDSVECPEMGAAIEALEGRAFEFPVDLPGVGKDVPLTAPRPHAVTSHLTIFLRTDGDSIKLEGSGGPIGELAAPILDAADRCEREKKSRQKTSTSK